MSESRYEADAAKMPLWKQHRLAESDHRSGGGQVSLMRVATIGCGMWITSVVVAGEELNNARTARFAIRSMSSINSSATGPGATHSSTA